MAQRTSINLIDDLDQKLSADETITFGIDGNHYEIDLSAKNAARLREALEKWISAGRRTGGRAKPNTQHSDSGLRQSAIRTWAIANGYTIGTRGRPNSEIVRAYNAAQKQPKNSGVKNPVFSSA